MNQSQNWYIIKTEEGNCQVIALDDDKVPTAEQYWGPFSSQEQAIASRVGLIRSGKCKPFT